MESVRINLFDNYIDYYSDYPEDIKVISFIYKKYVTMNYSEKNNLEFFICGNRDSNLILSNQLSTVHKKNKIEIKYRLANDNVFKTWLSPNTFIPPIDSDIFRNKYLILHGVGIFKDNNSYFFLGDNFSGKSSILFYALEKGYQCISDDLIFYDIEEKKVIPYYKPAGIRNTAVGINSYFKELYEKVKSVNHFEIENSENKVITRIFHIDDIFKSNIFLEYPIPINHIFIINDQANSLNSIVDRLKVLSKSTCSSNLSRDKKASALLNIALSLKSITYLKRRMNLDDLFEKI